MKEAVPLPIRPNADGFEEWINCGLVGMADTNQTYDALQSMDRLLKEFGLEVVIYASGTSDFWFTVERRD